MENSLTKSDLSQFRLRGLVAAVFTPFKKNGDLNLSQIDTYLDLLIKDGVRNIFVCGTTGEGLSLTLEERIKVTEKWLEIGRNKLDAVVVHVGATSIRETQKLAKHAQDNKASAIAAIPPIFFKPSTVEDLVSYFKDISDAAPEIPLWYYHNPGFTGVNFRLEAFLIALKKNPIPSFCGVKFTSQDMYDYGRSMQICNDHLHIQLLYAIDESFQVKFCICSCCDIASQYLPSNYEPGNICHQTMRQQALSALIFGEDALIGSTYNYAASVYRKMIKHFKAAEMDAARAYQYQIQEFINILIKYGGHVGTNKMIMKHGRLDLGPPRAPVHVLSSEEVENMKQDLEKIGFHKMINE